MGPFASICLLSFNRPPLLRQTIASAVHNAGYPFELIVHDDGSDEATVEVLRELHRDGLISLLMLNSPGHNEGQGVALNRMFHAAAGDPIIKMDHDLVLHEDWLKTAVEILEGNEQRNEEAGAMEPRIGALGLFEYHHPPVDAGEMFVKNWHDEWNEVADFVGSCMVIPRVAWELLGPFEERSPAFAEDAVFKQKIDTAPGWANGLTMNDLAGNVGFGIGPSTVNVRADDGTIQVQSIHDRPMVIDLAGAP